MTTRPAAQLLDPLEDGLALTRYQLLRPALERDIPIARLARERGIPLRTLRRWLAAYRRDGLVGLSRRSRSDRGTTRRLRPELRLLIEGAALVAPRPPAASVHRLAVAMAEDRGWPPPCYGTVYALLRRHGCQDGQALAAGTAIPLPGEPRRS